MVVRIMYYLLFKGDWREFEYVPAFLEKHTAQMSDKGQTSTQLVANDSKHRSGQVVHNQ